MEILSRKHLIDWEEEWINILGVSEVILFKNPLSELIKIINSEKTAE